MSTATEWDEVSAPAPQASEDWDSVSEQVHPDSAFGSFLRGAKANLASGIGGLVGGAAAGLAATPESAGLATIPAAVAGAGLGSAAGEALYKKYMGDDYAREQAQLEANRLAGHEFAGGAGEMLPSLLPATGAGGFVTKGLKAGSEEAAAAIQNMSKLQHVGSAAEAGARMGVASEAKKQVDEDKFDPTALATHPLEDAIKFGPVGLIPAAKGILGTVMKAVPDAAVMTLTGDLYDHLVKDKPLSLSGYVDETGKSIPSFMLLNALTSVLHGAGGAASKFLPGEGKNEEQTTAHIANQLKADQEVQKDVLDKSNEVDSATTAALDSNSPETAKALQATKPDIIDGTKEESTDRLKKETKDIIKTEEPEETTPDETTTTPTPAKPEDTLPVSTEPVVPVVGDQEVDQAPDAGRLAKWLSTQPKGMLDQMKKNAAKMIQDGKFASFTAPDGTYDGGRIEAYRELLSSMGYEMGETLENHNAHTIEAILNPVKTEPTTQENATLQEPSASGILPHPPEGTPETGSERVGVGQGKQGTEPPGTQETAPQSPPPAEAKALEPPPRAPETALEASQAPDRGKVAQETTGSPTALPEAPEGLSKNIRSMRVNDQEVTATLTPENAAKFDELVEKSKSTKSKGRGMALAAEKRALHPDFMTPSERKAAQDREAGNYKGKPVSVDGRNAKVVGNPFGDVSVEFEDGKRRTVSKNKIKPPIEPPEDKAQYAHGPTTLSHEGDNPEYPEALKGDNGDDPLEGEKPSDTANKYWDSVVEDGYGDDIPWNTKTQMQKSLSDLHDLFAKSNSTSHFYDEVGLTKEQINFFNRAGLTTAQLTQPPYQVSPLFKIEGRKTGSPMQRAESDSAWLARNPKSAEKLQRMGLVNKDGSILRDESGRIAKPSKSTEEKAQYSQKAPVVMSHEGVADIAEGLGKEAPEKQKSKTDNGMEFNARAQIQNDPELPERRAGEILKNPNVIKDNDVHILAPRAIELRNEIIRRQTTVNDSRTSSDRRKEELSKIKEADEKLSKILQAASYMGSTSGRALRSLQMIFGDDMTKEGLTESLKAANGGKDVSPKQREFVEKVAKLHRDILVEHNKNQESSFRENADAPLRSGARKLIKDIEGGASPKSSDPKHVANVKEWLKNRGYASGGRIKVVDQGPIVNRRTKESKDWFAKYDPETKTISINARNVTDEAHFHRLLNHEITHVVGKDADVVAKKAALLRSLTQAEREELEAWKANYKKGEKREDETIPKAVEIILARPAAAKSFLKSIKNAAKRILGIDMKDEDAHQMASDILAKGEKEFSSERFNGFGESFAQAKPEKMQKGEKYNPESDKALLKKEMADNMGSEGGELAGVISDEAFKAAARLAAHEESLSEEEPDHSFSESIFKQIKEASPEGSLLTHEDVKDKMDDWMRQNAPTKEHIADKMEKNRAAQSQSTDDKELARLQAEYEKLKETLKNGDFVKTTPKAKVLSAEAQALKIKMDVIKEQIATAKIEAKQKSQPGLYRVADAAARWKRFAILSSPISALKLASAVVTRSGSMPIEDFLGSAWANLLGKTGRAATIEGRFSPSAYSKGLAKMITRGIMDSKETWARGHSDLDIQHGGAYSHGGWLAAFGRMHGAIKAPLKRFAFESAMQKQIESHILETGVEPSPEALIRFSARAYQHAQRTLFMQDNVVTDAFQRAVSTMDRSGGMGKLGATTLKLLLPIVRVPTNIAGEAFNYVGGVPAGLYNLSKVWKSGLASLPEDHADMVIRQLKKGSIGGAFMLMGYLNPGLAGGYYQRDQKHAQGDAKIGQLRIGGVDIPKWASHIPLLEALHFGSTIRRVSDAHDSKSGGVKGLGEGAAAALWGLTSEVPFVDEAIRAGNLGDQAGREKFLHDEAKSMIPAGLDYVARQRDLDSSGEPRKVKTDTMADALKSSIPGLRNQLPTKEQR